MMEKIEKNKTNNYELISITSYEKDYLTNNYVVKNNSDKDLYVFMLKSKQTRYPKSFELKKGESISLSTTLTYKFVDIIEVKNV